MAWAIAIALYSLAGGIFLFLFGPYLFFFSPEWQVFGGIAMAVMGVAVVQLAALGTRSYVFARVTKFLWPIIIIVCAVRAIIMCVELNRGKEKIQWECDNDLQLWPESVAKNYSTPYDMPTQICIVGFPGLNTAFIVSLLIDLGFQLYMFFLAWRFCARLEHYSGMKGPFGNGYYNA